MIKIKFGTSGWRDIIAHNFTNQNVRVVTQSIADYVKSKSAPGTRPAVIIGYDTRFMSEDFAKVSACVLAANGVIAVYCKRDTPTPVIAYEIIRNGYAGGINFTASHNPFEYNGIKFSPSWGGPALPETTDAIENRCNEILMNPQRIRETPWEEGRKKKLIKETNPQETFLKRIKELVDIKAIKKSRLKTGIDLLYGTAKGYLDELLFSAGLKPIILHNYRDVLFGGHRPEPDEERLQELKKIILEKGLHLGMACDGDADRFGILDSDGTYITPNEVVSLALYHLIKTRAWKGVVVRSVMTTHFIDAIARRYGIEVRETPVGFKFIGEIMTNEPGSFIIGGEESGGLTIRGHVPEKDGILACMLIAEMCSIEKKSIRRIISDISKQVGHFITKRINFSLTPEIIERLKTRLKDNPPTEFANVKVKEIVTVDGSKFLLEDGSWVGMRLSGTEPVVRLYIETNTREKLSLLRGASEKIIK
ncbi:MAG: phosphoglucomutase/phosphomannomutase family protein [Elusimicrobia bacterium]|nr:phosphoglucomutase/phosphomannomutase family protein [Elusimicrobiota bacterium]